MTYQEKIIDVVTGEEIIRPYTKEEIDEVKKAIAEAELIAQAETAKAVAKAALLSKLDITEAEAKLLLS
jgi:hypothetical protein